MSFFPWVFLFSLLILLGAGKGGQAVWSLAAAQGELTTP